MSEPHFDIEREQWRKACEGPAPNIGARFGSRKRKMLFEKRTATSKGYKSVATKKRPA
jgi:hypothetical protein